MKFDDYQQKIKKYDQYTETDNPLDPGLFEKVLGISGEAGEVADKLKKIVRDKGGKISDEDKIEIAKELGDVIWYVASTARYLGIPFSEVAKKNVEKLESRYQRGKLNGDGDNR